MRNNFAAINRWLCRLLAQIRLAYNTIYFVELACFLIAMLLLLKKLKSYHSFLSVRVLVKIEGGKIRGIVVVWLLRLRWISLIIFLKCIYRMLESFTKPFFLLFWYSNVREKSRGVARWRRIFAPSFLCASRVQLVMCFFSSYMDFPSNFCQDIQM